MDINVALDNGAYMPEKAHLEDGGFDLRTPEPFWVMAHSCRTVDTGVHIQIPVGYVGFLKSKSGLNVKSNIVGEGVIDSGYTGSIKVKLYNNGDSDYMFGEGDKIIQLVILPIPYVKLHQVESITPTNSRGDNGFGSTGR